MALEVFNTLSNRLEPLQPLEDKRIRMYSCGPTVYDYGHIGNFRTFVFVDLFRRFDVMRHWHDVDQIGFETFVSPDGLHMNDWSYACLAKALGQAIAEAAERPTATAIGPSISLR